MIITSKLAEEIVRDSVSEKSDIIDIVVLPVSVAAFLTPLSISNFLSKMKLKKEEYDMILIPGLVKGDASILEERVGIPSFKGPEHAADIIETIDFFRKGEKLDKIKPANYLSEKTIAEILDYISDFNKSLIQRNLSAVLKIGREVSPVFLSPSLMPTVVSEIVDAPKYSFEKMIEIAKYYLSNGAGIIDIGMFAGKSHPEFFPKVISPLKEELNVPISIDTLNPEEILSGIDAGADLVLSLNSKNMKFLEDHIDSTLRDEVGFCVIPDFETITRGPLSLRLKSLNENLKLAKELGFKKIIADAILDPPISGSLSGSLATFKLFREIDPETPLLMGVGNVTELVDADSFGLNALLATMTIELGVSLLLTTEESNKTLGCVRELKKSTLFAFYAKLKNTNPKNIGISMLYAKDRKNYDQKIDQSIDEKIIVITTEYKSEYVADRKGFFKISIDREKKELIAFFYPSAKSAPSHEIRGKVAESVCKKIVELELISNMDHASYLGRELMKAEICLLSGKSYVQDQPFMFGDENYLYPKKSD